MRTWVRRVALGGLVVLLFGCGGSEESAHGAITPTTASVTATTAAPSSTTVTVATSTLETTTAVPSTTAAVREVWDLVYISDSSGWGVADAYAARIAADNLGIAVEVHDLWRGSLPATLVLEALRTGNYFNSDEGGVVKLPPLIAEAEVIVVYGNPNGSESVENPWDWNCAFGLEYQPVCRQSTACGPETFEQYESDLAAIYDEIFAIRDGAPVILRTADWYMPWGPLQTWTECEHGDVCRQCWRNFSDAIHRVAERYNVPVAGLLDAFSGAELNEQFPKEFTADDVHPNADGAAAIAAVLGDLGYAPVDPPS